MREIRFRAWHKQYYKMHGWEWVKELDYPFHESSGHIEDRDGPFADSMCIVMQYTGLKDKNGREIYEGDILRFGKKAHEKGCYCDHCWPDCPEGTIVLVVWISSGFQIIPPDAYPERDGICQECASYGGLLSPNHEMKIGYFAEVIGNIYENPDLIPKHLP